MSTASATPGYWTLTATGRPSRVTARWTCPIEAAANASSSNSANTADGFSPSSSRSSFSTPLERQRRDVVAQRGERLLEVLALVLGQRGEVDRGEHLADLHRRAAHLAELLDELARERRGALAGGGVGALGRAHDVRGARPDPAGRLPGDEPAEPRGAREARGRRLAGLVGHASRLRSRAAAADHTANRRPRRLARRDPRVRPRPRQPDRRAHRLQRRPGAAVRDRSRRHRRGGAARRRRDPRRGARPRRARRVPGRGPRPRRRLARVRARHGGRAARDAASRSRARGSRSRATSRAAPGLSSSAALEAALCARAARPSPAPRSPTASSWRKLCSRVENDWVGAETGLLDQLASLLRPRGRGDPDRLRHARRSTPVPLELGDWRLVTLESGAEHGHAAGGYNERRAECRAACEALGIEQLSARPTRTRPRRCPRRCDRRARHVLSENARVDAMVAALRAGDLEAAGRAARRLAREPARRLRGERARGRGDGGGAQATPARPARGWSAAASAARCWPCSRRARRRPAGAVAVAPGRRRRRCSEPRRSASTRAPRASGRANAQTRKSAATTSIATPTHRLRFQPAALSISASDAPSPRIDQDHAVDRGTGRR